MSIANTTQPTVATQVNLTGFNTMQLHCIADKLITVYSELQLESVLLELQSYKASDELCSKLLILSGGSNMLLPPHLQATVLHPKLMGIEVIDESATHVCLEVCVGENWHDLVLQTVNKGWYGLENLALIPGLTGAAPVQNIGAYGVQLEDYLTYVRALHLPTMTWHKLDKQACKFDYRDSMFKQQIGDWLITKVGFRLHKDSTQTKANYGDVHTHAIALACKAGRDSITPVDVMQAIIDIRQSKLPDPNVLPNCGSFFKNPIISTEHFNNLKIAYPNIVGYRQDDKHTKVAAGWLIDNAGLKGGGIAPIFTHDTQALVLVNHGIDKDYLVTQNDVATTQTYIQKIIFNKYEIALEREPMWINANGSICLDD